MPLAHCPMSLSTSTLSNFGAVRDSVYEHVDRVCEGLKSGPWADKCDAFIKPDGTYGPYGQAIDAMISPETHPNLFNGVAQDMDKICPAFNTWNGPDAIENKKTFWILFAAAVADAESSCDQKTPEHRGPPVRHGARGILKGLYQLNKNHENEALKGATPDQKCSVGSSLTATGSNVCFFKMMNYYVGVHRSIFHSRRDPERYFDTIFTNAGGDKVRKRLALYKACKA